MQQLTKAHIVETFNDLLREYPFEKITAKMIIDRAGVSKSTFYRFFLDKHDVLYFNYKNNIDQWVKNQGCKNWKELFVCVYASSLTDHAREKNAFAYSGADSYFQILYRYSYELVEMAAPNCICASVTAEDYPDIGGIYYNGIGGGYFCHIFV